jgi:hypothetical protein
MTDSEACPTYKNHSEWEKWQEEKAVVQDGSGYYAALKCRADFGCVYHEEANP